jgi:hypothetical protein
MFLEPCYDKVKEYGNADVNVFGFLVEDNFFLFVTQFAELIRQF